MPSFRAASAFSFALAIALLAGRPAFAASVRVDLATALAAMTQEACERVYGPEDTAGVEGCIDAYLLENERSNERLAEEGGEGEQICLAQGGMLLDRMEPCTAALAETIQAERDEDTGAFFRAIGKVMRVCAADQLCCG